jgi:hypothetical protein
MCHRRGATTRLKMQQRPLLAARAAECADGVEDAGIAEGMFLMLAMPRVYYR